MTCNGVSSNPSIETPQVTVVTNKKHSKLNHLAIILGAAGGASFAVLLTSLGVFLYVRKRTAKHDQATYTASKQNINIVIIMEINLLLTFFKEIVFIVKKQQ